MMGKMKFSLTSAAIIVSAVCVLLAVNSAALNVRLNREKSRIGVLDSQVAQLKAELSDIKMKYNEEARFVKDLKYSLEAAKREAEDIRIKADNLEKVNRDLEARLDAGLNALQGKGKTANSLE